MTAEETGTRAFIVNGHRGALTEGSTTTTVLAVEQISGAVAAVRVSASSALYNGDVISLPGNRFPYKQRGIHYDSLL